MPERVGVLVENVEHGLALGNLLPGWAVISGPDVWLEGLPPQDRRILRGEGEDQQQNHAIVTTAGLPDAGCFDVLIRADAGADGAKKSINVNRLLVDVDDQALKHAQDLLEAHGLELGGKGGVYDLDAGDCAPLLGFELHKHDERLKLDLSTKTWSKLEEHLREAHKDPNPLEAAKAKIRGWANAHGPALHKRGPQATRIFRTAAKYGFREVFSRGDLKRQLKASWERWLEVRGTD